MSSLDPTAGELLGILSLFDPDEIPDDLLRSKPIRKQEGAPEVLQNLSSYVKALTSLRQSSLVRKRRAEKVFSTHRLIQDSMRRQWDADESRQAFRKRENLSGHDHNAPCDTGEQLDLLLSTADDR